MTGRGVGVKKGPKLGDVISEQPLMSESSVSLSSSFHHRSYNSVDQKQTEFHYFQSTFKVLTLYSSFNYSIVFSLINNKDIYINRSLEEIC